MAYLAAQNDLSISLLLYSSFRFLLDLFTLLLLGVSGSIRCFWHFILKCGQNEMRWEMLDVNRCCACPVKMRMDNVREQMRVFFSAAWPFQVTIILSSMFPSTMVGLSGLMNRKMFQWSKWMPTIQTDTASIWEMLVQCSNHDKTICTMISIQEVRFLITVLRKRVIH